MEVFVLTTQVVVDFEDYNTVEVFSTMEKAKAEFKKIAKSEWKKIKKYDENWIVELSEDEFNAFQEYSYAENRVRVNIHKVEVK